VKTAFFPWRDGNRAAGGHGSREPGREIHRKARRGVASYRLRVENIEETLKNLKEQGVRLIDETPRYGAGGAKIAFVHPKSSGGVLLEISHGRKRKHDGAEDRRTLRKVMRKREESRRGGGEKAVGSSTRRGKGRRVSG
jgi:hypothetical protein